MFRNTPPLTPKNPSGPLQVLLIGRISTEHQKEESIEASFADDERYLKTLYSGEAEIHRFGERASGWKINRESIRAAETKIQSGEIDVVIMEDIGRGYRNPQYQFRLAHMCFDHGTRLICPGDGIDTAESNWEVALQTAVLRHGLHVPDTRRRVRRSATYAFHNGGMVLKVRAFYRKRSVEEAAPHGGLRIEKLNQYASVVMGMRARVLRGESYELIARWLNSEGIPPGNYAVSGEWTGRLVEGNLRDTLLWGFRTFRVQEHELIFETGDHRRVPNPNPETQLVPELAFMTKEEHDELIQVMDERRAVRKRETPCPRNRVPRKESYFPGQHLVCSCCGAELYWYSPKNLKCRHVFPGRPERCWNRVLVDAEVVRTRLLPKIIEELRLRPVHFNRFVDALWASFETSLKSGNRERDRRESRIRELEKRARSTTELLIRCPDSESLTQSLRDTETALKKLRAERSADVRTPCESRVQTKADMLENLETVVLDLAQSSFEFGRIMRKAFPDFRLIPVQAIGNTQVRPRVQLVLPADPESGRDEVVLTVDAFEPSIPIKHAFECLRLSGLHPDWTLERIGQEVGISKKAASEAVAYGELLREHGAMDPFEELTACPENAARWKKSPDQPPQSDEPPSTESAND